MKKLIAVLALTLSCHSQGIAKTVVTFATGIQGDVKQQYEYNLVKLALDNTVEDYGSYQINLRPGDTPSYTRMRVEAEEKQFNNYLYKDSVSNELLEKLQAVHFPVELGVAGYRVGLISPEAQSKLRTVQTKEDASSLKIIQGRGWLDGDILRSQGFRVVEGSHIEGLFYMAANNRGDMFPLGAHELKREWDKFKHIDGLRYDTEICIYYPLPKFFFTHPDNKLLAERVQIGLERAYQSGELSALWKEYFYERFQFSNLKQRRIFKFANPMISKVDRRYEQYILDPNTL
ncbi:SMF protein [Catenovulum agarivorans DS-2]|uniref:SMF protein n=1 Tax=Catenovulum agarivorans DS-2 TaxID=1328313 RepID=W7QZF7_9ALTE|nr:hypothetical protein [Catenovulum agarivorans]EWH10745.1 SMF protein [Catenovulum agarivorans DS-2]